MKFLLDENLSDRIIPRILDLYPGSVHVKTQNLTQADDSLIWNFARQQGLTIVSKDADFHQRALVFGQPPKLIFLRGGNCATSRITQLLRADFPLVSEFDLDPSATILILTVHRA